MYIYVAVGVFAAQHGGGRRHHSQGPRHRDACPLGPWQVAAPFTGPSAQRLLSSRAPGRWWHHSQGPRYGDTCPLGPWQASAGFKSHFSLQIFR